MMPLNECACMCVWVIFVFSHKMHSTVFKSNVFGVSPSFSRCVYFVHELLFIYSKERNRKNMAILLLFLNAKQIF